MNYYDNFYEGLNDNRNHLYRQIDTVSSLNKLSSTLNSELYNLKNYKINVKGEYSYLIKEHLNKMIDTLHKYDDSLQELIKIKKGFPIYQLGDIENISLIKTLASIDYKPSMIINNITKEFNTLKSLINESISISEKEKDYQTINILSNLLFDINIVLTNYEL